METSRKNLLKQPFFWTSICCLLSLSVLISLYAYGWVAPNTTPNSNAGAAINYNGGKVGIGTVIPSGLLSVTPTQYSTGTVSQSLTTVTGVGTTFTSTMVGSQLVYANGVSAGTITAVTDATHLTVSTSQTVASQTYNIAYTGLQVAATGKVGVGTTSPSEMLEVFGNIKLSGTTPTYKLTNLLTPTADSDAATKAYVDAAVAGISGGTSFIINQADLINKKTGKMLDPSNVCKASIANTSYSNYTLADIDATNTWNGVLRIDSTSLTDSDSNGLKETSLLSVGKLGFDQNGVLIEGAPADPRTQIRCMFITTTTYNGNLGGKTGAAAKCQAEATSAGITGTYQALLSAGYLPSPLSGSYPLVTASNVTVRSPASGITTFGTALLASPNKSAANTAITPGSAWGMPGSYNCTAWADTAGNGCYLRMGSWSSASTSDCSNTSGTNGWGGYYTSYQVCTNLLPLVCVEIN